MYLQIIMELKNPNANCKVIDLCNTLLSDDQALNLLIVLQDSPHAKNIKQLSLHKNALTFLHLPKTLTGLQTINVSDNNLLSLYIPEELTELQYIAANNNQISQFYISPKLRKLEKIEIIGNRRQLPILFLPAELNGKMTLLTDENQQISYTLDKVSHNKEDLFNAIFAQNNHNLSVKIDKLLSTIFGELAVDVNFINNELNSLLFNWGFINTNPEYVIFLENLKKIRICGLAINKISTLNLKLIDGVFEIVCAQKELEETHANLLEVIFDKEHNLSPEMVDKLRADLQHLFNNINAHQAKPVVNKLLINAYTNYQSTTSIPMHTQTNVKSSNANIDLDNHWYNADDILRGISQQFALQQLYLEKYNSFVLFKNREIYTQYHDASRVFAVATPQTILSKLKYAKKNKAWLEREKEATPQVQLQDLNDMVKKISQQDSKVISSSILFPLHRNGNHWCVMRLNYLYGHYANAEIYDTFIIPPETEEAIKHHFRATLLNKRDRFNLTIHRLEQPDSDSCGVIAADIIYRLITNQHIQTIYSANDIRLLRETQALRKNDQECSSSSSKRMHI